MDSPSKPTFKCPECERTYSSPTNLNQHKRSAHEGRRFLCDKCDKSFTRMHNMKKHKCATAQYHCNDCSEVFSTPRELTVHNCRFHQTTVQSAPSTSSANGEQHGPSEASSTSNNDDRGTKERTCRTCKRRFIDQKSLYRHQVMKGHRVLPSQSGSGAKKVKRPWGEGPAPWEDQESGEVIDPELQEAYDLNAAFILAQNQPGDQAVAQPGVQAKDQAEDQSVVSLYNLPVTNNLTIDDLMEQARDIYQSLDSSFRLNLAFGVILRNVETGEYRYFKPYAADPLFNNPIYITGVKDLEKLRKRLQRLDIMTFLLKQRLNTKWKPVLITNVQFYAFRLNFPLGHPPVILPDYVKNHSAIISLDCNKGTKRFYEDRLCAFRCLALHKDPSSREALEKPTQDLYYKWVVYCRNHHHLESLDKVTHQEYKGLSPAHFSDFEACFRVNVNVFRLNEKKVAQPLYKTRGLFDVHMNLNLYEKHLSLITNINMYCKRYQCPLCERLFKRIDLQQKHQRRCTGQTKLIFPGGFHHTPKTVFDELDESDLHVTPGERFFPWFVVFDFECFLKSIDTGTQKLRWTQEHRPISVSICSNVPGFTSPHCIVNPDSDELISAMMEYISVIAEKVTKIAKEKYEWVFEELEKWQKDDDGSVKMNSDADDNDDMDDDMYDDMDDMDDMDDKDSASTPQAKWKKHVNKLYGKLLGYCSQVPVLGFNSARYDLNIVKEKLPKHLSLHVAESQAFTVKKNNAYLCQSNQNFKFLDVTQYLSPGTSYAQFLKAFGVEERKGFFPYEYLDSPEKLNETRLPPMGEAWYSSLKQKSVLDDGVKSIEDNYADLEEVWRREGMSTFRDFLEWYNNLDVGPFVEAVQAMQRFYFEDGIDLFKTTMSVPGVARQKLFRESQKKGVSFALFDKKNEDLYHTVKANVVGGPSIIFTRYHKAERTLIRGNPAKRCKKVVGYDANALYLWAIDQPMPTGAFVRRQAKNDFKPERRDRYTSMYDWMDWMKQKFNADIKHKLNWGREKRVGPYLVDGWIPDSTILLEFNGCYYHGHECHLTMHARNKDKSRKLLEKRLRDTEARAAYIRSQGYQLYEMWECEYHRQCQENDDLKSFVEQRAPPFARKKRGKVSQQDILKAVETGELFGMVEVDIHVPEQWAPGQNPHGTRLSPYEYFQEMTPLFCNAEVPFEDLGEHMQDYIRENDLSTKPRRMLVGGLKARQMMIATPLLQWYLQHGMMVDRVYQVVEYTPNACFDQFVRDVCSARREADRDPSAAIRGDTAKLTGNSAYGSVLINKEKHQTVSYVHGHTKASDQVNIPQFRKLTNLDGDYFEVEMGKKFLRLDTPVQLGYFILQYAKLRMLSYYYDCMDVYVDRCDFEYMEMDTDSAYIALSASSLSEVIKPDKQVAFHNQLKGLCVEQQLENDMRWFPRNCCSIHALHDKRTPGLFKLEYEGDEMIGLCSKTYLVAQITLQRMPKPSMTSSVRCAQRILRRARYTVRGKRTSVMKKTSLTKAMIGRFEKKVKFSSKGISKRTLRTPLAAFRQVLRTGVPGEGMNRGFRLRGNTMCTYQQTRRGLSYLYCKRRVLDDGISTVPLDIELCPYSTREVSSDDTEII